METIGNQRAMKYEEEVRNAYEKGVEDSRTITEKLKDNYEKTVTKAADFMKDENERETVRADEAEMERDLWKDKYYKMISLYDEVMSNYEGAVRELQIS